MRPLLVLGAALLLSGCAPVHHSWHWKEADLDRNRFNLGLSRGAHDARALAGWVEQGRVVAASGTSTYGVGGDLRLTVRYDADITGGIGPSTHHEKACYLFTTPDGHDVAFEKVAC